LDEFKYTDKKHECLSCPYKKALTINSDGDMYLGQWKGNERNGRGTEILFNDDGSAFSLYEGYWKGGKRYGKGRRLWYDGNRYMG
jgi:hypothetical protein